MRLAWSNAKLFNLEGSDLWMAADRLSKEFEALFCAWVINPPDGYGCVCVCVCARVWYVCLFYLFLGCFIFSLSVDRVT